VARRSGAVLGQVIGRNTRSTVAGAAIGAAAGTAVAIGTADVDAVVDPGRPRHDSARPPSITIERRGHLRIRDFRNGGIQGGAIEHFRGGER
jgi:hypothetical protein